MREVTCTACMDLFQRCHALYLGHKNVPLFLKVDVYSSHATFTSLRTFEVVKISGKDCKISSIYELPKCLQRSRRRYTASSCLYDVGQKRSLVSVRTGYFLFLDPLLS